MSNYPSLKPPYTFTKKFRFPIDQLSRSVMDQEVERLRHGVIPIIGDDGGRPYLVGSAVALHFGGVSFLVTAHHVLEDSSGPLGYFGADGFSRPFDGVFEVSEADDLAVKLMSESELDALCHIPFLNENDLASDEDIQGHFYASVVGYPATAAKRRDKITLETPMEATGGFASTDEDGMISVHFDKKEGSFSEKGHTDPRDQYGKSGGAIFAMRVSGRTIIPTHSAKMVGIGIEWRKDEKRIVGAGLTALKQLLDAAITGAAEI